jgi:ribonucleotide reductase alpha subunit
MSKKAKPIKTTDLKIASKAQQQKKKFKINIDNKRDERLTVFGKAVLKDRYLMPGEEYQDLFARVASYYADDEAHANRLYNYISNLWFMPATPILSNGGTERGLPISCFLNECNDSLHGIVDLWNENVWLASRGGGGLVRQLQTGNLQQYALYIALGIVITLSVVLMR